MWGLDAEPARIETRGSWMTVDRCRGTTKDGKPCAAKPRPGTARCPWHSDDLADRRREWSRRGGVNSSNKARARKHLPDGTMSAPELGGLLGLVLKGVIAGKIEPGVGNAAANIARAMNDVIKTADIEERLRDLEEAAGLSDRRRG